MDRAGIRKRFCALALGPLVGYRGTLQVLQYVYDLLLRTEIGANRNMVDAPLRIMMAGHSASPEYWKAIRFALIDLVRQKGWPVALITQSMREEMMPYHHWVCDALAKASRSRGNLPVAETIATTHALAQMVRGAGLGHTAPNDQWHSHLLRIDGPADFAADLGSFTRVEFQDGTKTAPTQDYHGPGRVHTHTVCVRFA